MSELPKCGKCNGFHWRFHPCVAQESPRQPRVEWRSDPDWSDWGDRLESYERRGQNMFLKRGSE